MVKYSYDCEEDKELLLNSFMNIALLIFGEKNSDAVCSFEKYWEMKVSNVNVFPQGTLHDRINDTTPGICRLDEETQKLIIEMFGYIDSTSNQSSWIKHEGTHEYCHSFVDLLPQLVAKHKDGIIKNGIYCENYMGLIKETNPSTGELVGQDYYGKMFNETMMDIISSIAINYFDSNNEDTKTADYILGNNYRDWGNEKTGYAMFTSLTRLAIAAFSNDASIDYDSVIKSGHGIVDYNVNMKNGEKRQANDFLYGIVCDPLHIEEEFDKYMGSGYYRNFCERLDKLFLESLDDQKLSSDDVKYVMNVLPDFLNKKLDYYLRNNLMDVVEANAIVSNFNRIWNMMQFEYEAYFSQEEINNIARRAGR